MTIVQFILYGLGGVLVGALLIILIDSIYMAITGKSKIRGR